MLTPQRFIVIHRDSPNDPPQYFGPFVSQSIAERFIDTKFPEKPKSRTFMRTLENPRELDS